MIRRFALGKEAAVSIAESHPARLAPMFELGEAALAEEAAAMAKCDEAVAYTHPGKLHPLFGCNSQSREPSRATKSRCRR